MAIRRGRFARTSISAEVDDLRFVGWNDRISSIRPAGFTRNNNGRGWGWGNQRDRRDGVRTESRLILYDRTNYRGQSRDVLGSATNLGAAGDRARSVQIYGGTWELCEGVFRNARCVTIDNSVPDLQNLGLRNGVSSVRELSGTSATRRSRGWRF
jgi:Beta/Gamma crystallin